MEFSLLQQGEEWRKRGKELAGKAGKIATFIGTLYFLAKDSKRLLSRKEIYAAKKIGLATKVRRGEWNGFGFEWLGTELADGEQALPTILKAIEEEKKNFQELEEKGLRNSNRKTSRKEAWAKRLNQLTGCGMDFALKLAEEKLEAKNRKISEMQERQIMDFSSRREKLINAMRRENPLRRIRDEEHAKAILAAHDRHQNTNYEEKLEEGREMAMERELEWNEIREYARTVCSPKNNQNF